MRPEGRKVSLIDEIYAFRNALPIYCAGVATKQELWMERSLPFLNEGRPESVEF